MVIMRLLFCFCFLLSSLAFGYSEEQLDTVIKKWQSFPSFQKELSQSQASLEETDLARAMAMRLVEFTKTYMEWELSALKEPLEDIEKSWKISAGWQGLYRLHSTFREGLAACTDAECVDNRVKWQKRLFNWIERIGSNPTVPERMESLTKDVVHHIGQFFGFGKTPKFVVPASLIAHIYDEAAAKIDQTSLPSYSSISKLPIDKARLAQKLILAQLARSALSLDDVPPFIRPTADKNNKFTHEWRYSENVWLEAIRDSRLKHLAGEAEEFTIPLRREFGGSHYLACHTKGDIPKASHVGMGIGYTKWFCTSEQGGSYELTGMSTGLDISIGLGIESAVVFRSAMPDLHWFTPEGYSAGLELGLIPGIGGRLSMGIRPDLIRIYQADVEFGQGATLSAMGLKIAQTASAHSI